MTIQSVLSGLNMKRGARSAAIVTAAILAALVPVVPVATALRAQSLFRSDTTLVRVDVIVRDKDGNPVRGLQQKDFIVTEDGKLQQVTSFSIEEVSTEQQAAAFAPAPTVLGIDQLTDAARRTTMTTIVAPPKPAANAAAGAEKPPVPTEEPPKQDLAGRRFIVLFFDTSSMQPDEIDRAVKSANDYVDKQMSPADLVAVASVGQTLTILHDFTDDRDVLKSVLASFDVTSGTGFEQPEAAVTGDDSDATTDTDPADLPLDDSEFGIFNNDRRLRAMRVLCEALATIEQKKAILYFSSGLSRSGSDNEVELRAVTNAALRANASFYTVDSRGLSALPPGGAAGRGGRGGGSSAFSGRGMLSQFSSLNSSQETLTTLAADTGGQSFLDSNDFSSAFSRVQRDMSSYYLLGYASSNSAQDGKYRKISVKLKNGTLSYKIEARQGYYAPSDFAHLKKEDRQHQLEDQIAAAVSITDLPVVATTSWFRVSADRFYVPVSIAIPGSAVHPPTAPTQDRNRAAVDLLFVVTDEQGRQVGHVQDQMQIPAAQTGSLAGKQLQYQSGLTLPAGHFRVKVAVRENSDGTLGSFEFPITIPDLKTEPLKVSPVVLSTQLRSLRGGGPGGRGGPGGQGGGPGGRGGGPGGGPGGGGPGAGGPGGGGFGPPGFTSQRGGGAPFGENSPNPLLRGGQEILQSLTHVATQGQQMYFYYEVYDPAVEPAGPTGTPQLRTSLAFYRGRVKVFETPAVDRTTIDDPERKAVIFQFALPASELKPGLYTCQVNVVDEISGKFAFPRLAVYVKEAPKPAAPTPAAAPATPAPAAAAPPAGD